MELAADVAPTRGHGEPLIVAHRGAWEAAPQNSLAALASAISLGCDMAELDVRRTRDGRLVAVHDARVGGTPVSSLDHHQVRSRLRPGQAPRLEELLELAAGRIALDVELKEADYVDRVVATLQAGLTPNQYVVTSFIDAVLAGVRRVAPGVRTGLLIRPDRRPRRLGLRLEQTGADFIAPHASLARAGLLGWAANRGLDSFVWTVNDRRALGLMIADPRVSAVITDRPAEALSVRELGAGPLPPARSGWWDNSR